SYELSLLCGAHASAGQVDEARRIRDELVERASRSYVPPLDLAVAHAAMNDRESALASLERALDERNALMWYRTHLPNFDALRNEPRWQAIADRLARVAPMRRGGTG
ncbi:MAG: hypothetical protein ABI592_16945, partial [Acidobacteriota bacterium]